MAWWEATLAAVWTGLNGLFQTLANSSGVAEWFQVIVGLVMVPITWWIASQAASQNFGMLLTEDSLRRDSELALADKKTDRQIFAKQAFLVTQMRYCVGRIRDSGNEIADGEAFSFQSVSSLFRNIDHYYVTIDETNTYDHCNHSDSIALMAVIDDFMHLIARVRMDLAMILNMSSYSQLVSRTNGVPLNVELGAYVIDVSGRLDSLFRTARQLLSPEVEGWLRPFDDTPPPQPPRVVEPPLPATLNAVLTAAAGQRKFHVPEPPPILMQRATRSP